MAGIFGNITQADVSTFNLTQGQQLVYTAIQEYLARVNADMQQALRVFIETDTEDHTERYQLPGGGRLQRRGLSASPATVKASGSWDVAYPLEDFAAAIAGDDVTLAYQSLAEMERHVQTVVNQDINTVRFEILKRLFNSTAATFVDARWGSLTVQPLANGDTVTYPPVLGSESDATENHYLESGYAASAISDTNNPYATMVDELTEHFGDVTGGSNIVTFINNAQIAKTTVLTNFVEVPDQFIRVGSNTDVPERLPDVPGRIIGRMEDGTWVSSWRWIPSGWMLAIHLETSAPLKMRRDPAFTGLGSGLQLVARDQEFPFSTAFWRHRFGVGVGNRLNGVVMELGTGGTYTVPTAYA